MLKSSLSFPVSTLCIVLAWVLGFSFFFGQIAGGQQIHEDVVNVDTGLSYSGIQEAIDAPETLDKHTIRVGVGVFREHVTVTKSVSLEGQGPNASVIDGSGGIVAVDVVCNDVEISDLGIRNGVIGLRLNQVDNCGIVGNVLYNGSYGIRLFHSRNSLVAGNQVSGYSYFGIELDSSGNSTLKNNIIADNHYNFGVDGTLLRDFLNDIDVSNTVNGKPVRYLVNQRDVIIESSTFDGVGYLGLVNSSNVKVQNLDFQDNIQGLLFAFTSNSSISNVNAQNNWNGIHVQHSANVSVDEVKSTGNFDYGIKFLNSSNSRASHNSVENNGWAGIGLFWSRDSTLDWNEASYCTYDLHIVSTNDSVISRNTALARPGDYSIALYYSHNNSIYRNTFESALLFAETRDAMSFTPKNSWDNGLEGNYWLSYMGYDADRDGIGDASYAVGENNVDNCPLMGRFSEFSLIVNEKVYNVALISNSTVKELQFNADERRIMFDAIGQNGTAGFCRLAVPAGFLEELEGDDMGFLVNGEEPVLERQWSSDTHAYWYLSFANVPSEAAFDYLFVGMFILLVLVLAGVVLIVLWKRKAKL